MADDEAGHAEALLGSHKGPPDNAEELRREAADWRAIAEIIRRSPVVASALNQPEPDGWLCEWRWTTERGGGRWNFDMLCRTQEEADHLPRSRRNGDIEHRITPLYRGASQNGADVGGRSADEVWSAIESAVARFGDASYELGVADEFGAMDSNAGEEAQEAVEDLFKLLRALTSRSPVEK